MRNKKRGHNSERRLLEACGDMSARGFLHTEFLLLVHFYSPVDKVQISLLYGLMSKNEMEIKSYKRANLDSKISWQSHT